MSPLCGKMSSPFNLETAVERIRVRDCRVGWLVAALLLVLLAVNLPSGLTRGTRQGRPLQGRATTWPEASRPDGPVAVHSDA